MQNALFTSTRLDSRAESAAISAQFLPVNRLVHKMLRCYELTLTECTHSDSDRVRR